METDSIGKTVNAQTQETKLSSDSKRVLFVQMHFQGKLPPPHAQPLRGGCGVRKLQRSSREASGVL